MIKKDVKMIKKMIVHHDSKTYFLRSSSPTRPPNTKPAPFDRGDSNAVLVAEIRDSSPGSRELFDSA
jgi:hypothetical protein